MERQTLQTEDSTEVHNFIGAGLKGKITKNTFKAPTHLAERRKQDSTSVIVEQLTVFPQLFKFSFVFPQLASIFQMD